MNCKKCNSREATMYGFCMVCFYNLRDRVDEAHRKFHKSLDEGPHDDTEEQAILHDLVLDLYQIFRDDGPAKCPQCGVQMDTDDTISQTRGSHLCADCDADAEKELQLARQEDPPCSGTPEECERCSAECGSARRATYNPDAEDSPLEKEVQAAMQPMGAALAAWRKLQSDVNGLQAGRDHVWFSEHHPGEDSITLRSDYKKTFQRPESIRLYTQYQTGPGTLRMSEKFAEQLGFTANCNGGWEWAASLTEITVAQIKDRIIQLTARLRMK